MNRKEIKQAAWEKIKGNKWNLIWPVLVISILQSFVERMVKPPIQVDPNNVDLEELAAAFRSSTTDPMLFIIGVVFSILSVSYIAYVFNIVRNGKAEFNDIIECVKKNWLNILLFTVVSEFLMGLGLVLLIVPGIIIAMMYSMGKYIIVDEGTPGIEALKKSREMMKGYKMDYFIFLLSFIGWYLLIIPTLGIIMIWLFPYLTVAQVLYYEKLKEIRK